RSRKLVEAYNLDISVTKSLKLPKLEKKNQAETSEVGKIVETGLQ
ncbi:550_t:CDS:2, partial [Scutellospora calospora]